MEARNKIVCVSFSLALLLLSGCAGSANRGAGGSFTDSRDGQTYRTVRIGGQTWMAENLNYAADGSWCYCDLVIWASTEEALQAERDANCGKYGRLYDWNTAAEVCPAGWHLPSSEEWDALDNFVGKLNAGAKLKSKSPDWDGGDDYGFSALPGGIRTSEGSFGDIGSFGLWWTATKTGNDDSGVYYRSMSAGRPDITGHHTNGKDAGYSVRCIKD
jgi:uncharacterized protein (TIGR02145 family)